MPWDCEFCAEKFRSPEALRRHLRSKHKDRVKLAVFEHPVSPRTKPKRKPA